MFGGYIFLIFILVFLVFKSVGNYYLQCNTFLEVKMFVQLLDIVFKGKEIDIN